MHRLAAFLFCVFIHISCTAQSPDELNKQSKELLGKEDFTNAVPLLKKAAEGGNAEAQYNYGYCYQEGKGVTLDLKTANKWYMKAAKQGWIDAEFKLAYSYASGRGYEQDYKQAFYWAMQCALQNDPECMYNIATCYQQGLGTSQNTDSMLFWVIHIGSLPDIENLQQSANITAARLNLAIMYRDGDKIKKDLQKSYMWFLIYNESKRDYSFQEQLSHIDEIKALEKELTQADKEKIKQEAEMQLGRKLKNVDKLYTADIE